MQTIRKYRSILRIRFANGMQYRAAALAGIVTQFAWGGMYLILYHTFYQSGTGAFPMDMQALSAYIWLQQAFLALFMIWGMDNDIFELISSGNIAYDLCRPCDLYSMIFFRTLGSRLARAVLRCFPILLVAALLPSPYGIRLPPSWGAAGLFLVSFLLGALVVGAFCMLIYISAFLPFRQWRPFGCRCCCRFLFRSHYSPALFPGKIAGHFFAAPIRFHAKRALSNLWRRLGRIACARQHPDPGFLASGAAVVGAADDEKGASARCHPRAVNVSKSNFVNTSGKRGEFI